MYREAFLLFPGFKNPVFFNQYSTSKGDILFFLLAFIFGFTVVGFSSFLPINYFSLRAAMTMVSATLATPVSLPSAFLLFPGLIFPKKSRHLQHIP
jgi:hypothetical protein